MIQNAHILIITVSVLILIICPSLIASTEYVYDKNDTSEYNNNVNQHFDKLTPEKKNNR